MSKNQEGFGVAKFLLLVALAVVVMALGWYFAKHRSPAQITGASQLASLSGTVSAGPGAPVCSSQYGCGSAVVANHTLQILNRQGKVIDTTATDIYGKYSVHIPPGHYSLKLVPPVGMGTIKNNEVDVKSGNNTFNLEADTGIR